MAKPSEKAFKVWADYLETVTNIQECEGYCASHINNALASIWRELRSNRRVEGRSDRIIKKHAKKVYYYLAVLANTLYMTNPSIEDFGIEDPKELLSSLYGFRESMSRYVETISPHRNPHRAAACLVLFLYRRRGILLENILLNGR